MTVTGKDLIDLGFPPGAELGRALAHIRSHGLQGPALHAFLDQLRPPPPLPLQDAPAWSCNLEAADEAEAATLAGVTATMEALMRTPTLRAGAVMPDACLAGPMGTIPVGGVAVAQGALHPGMHSADICCSVMLTECTASDPKALLDAVQQITHFGPGGRPEGQRMPLPADLADGFRANVFLNDVKVLRTAAEHLGTQGDGNHFAFVGRSAARGTLCLVTHHGSRGPGAALHARGMRVAETFRRKLSPDTLPENAWIPADSPEGRAYWDALQLIRQWTKENHAAIHRAALLRAGARALDCIWNEHNFVFRRGDLYYHAKGATPVDADFLPDTAGVQILPLNMAEPVLLIRGTATPRNLGFAPHGAGRNVSRTAYRRRLAGQPEAHVLARETAGIDARFHSGHVDLSELPGAYKPAARLRAQMARFGLADVVDEINPYGCIMAGDWERDAPWRQRAAARAAGGAGPAA